MSDGRVPGDEPEDFDARVRRELAGLLRVEPDRVHPDARLAEDLKVDSLEFLSVVVGLERAFGVEIPDKEAARLKTVAQVAAAVRRQLAPGRFGTACAAEPTRRAS